MRSGNQARLGSTLPSRESAESGAPLPSRRELFSSLGNGFMGGALAYLLGRDLLSAQPLPADSGQAPDLKPRRPHFEPRAKSVIHLFMNGGHSQIDLFDPKPTLKKYEGQPPGRDLTNDVEQIASVGTLMPSPFEFQKRGRCGMEISEMLPFLSRKVDDIALVRSMFTKHFNHEPAIFLMQSGRTIVGRPSLGSWVVYGLGSENQNLPAYVVLDDPKMLPVNGLQNWQAGWLPPVYQGTRLKSEGSPLLNLQPKEEFPTPVLNMARSILSRLDRGHLHRHPGRPELQARITNYELAARMQIAASDALDLSQESPATHEMYGLNDEATASYGRRCLMARRLVERGVRMVQLYIEEQIWDQHSDLAGGLRYACGKTDKPVHALLTDLKQRGLWDSTLVVWGGEFGRLPLSQHPDKKAGRDHGPPGFSVWLAGAGIKGGTVYGATDELGHRAVENPVSVHDLHATILHLLGMNHRDLVYRREGRSERLTDEFPARVVKGILA